MKRASCQSPIASNSESDRPQSDADRVDDVERRAGRDAHDEWHRQDRREHALQREDDEEALPCEAGLVGRADRLIAPVFGVRRNCAT